MAHKSSNGWNFCDVVSRIDNEGLGYFILHYTNSNSMPDDKSKELFEKAEQAMNDFLDYVQSQEEC